MLVPIIVAVVTSGAAGHFVAGWLNRRKVRAEADSITVETAGRLVGMLREQVESQGRRITLIEERLAREQRETQRLRRWVGLLIEQIRGLGVEPVSEPAE